MKVDGNRLRELRKNKQLTQKQVADYLNLTPKMISFYENEERVPPADILSKLADYYGVTTDFLLGRENPSFVFGKRLKSIRESYGYSKIFLSDYFSVSPYTITKWETDTIPQQEIVSKLANLLHTTPEYLLGKTDNLLNEEDSKLFEPWQNKSSSFQDQAIPIDSFRQIPLVGYGSCGELLFSEQNIEEYISFPANFLNGGEYFALRVIGDSMIDAGIVEGSVIIVRKQSTCDSGDIVVVCVEDETTVKRVFFNGSQIELVPENRKYPRKSYPSKKVIIQGVVKKSLSDVV